jgi:tagaturonate reductase
MTYPRLSVRLLDGSHRFPDNLVVPTLAPLPTRVLQFGEGNFLRAFVDWMLQRMNQRGLFAGRATLVQPIPAGLAPVVNAQDGLFTVVLRGIKDGTPTESREIVASVTGCVDPYTDTRAFLACATNPELRFIVSNTTEAGIRVDASDALAAQPATSFPGKLTQLLYARYRHFSGATERGLVLLPCELIERNGDTLASAVKELAQRWQLPLEFGQWLDAACIFTNTLVDRIVTGYPKDEAPALSAELGYEDELLVTGESFHCWVIESEAPLERELPLRESGLNVIWTPNMTPYRERKVRILNGAHTMLALGAYLAGRNTVREAMQDAGFRSYVERGIQDEILPTLTLPRHDLESFAESVVERFDNPAIKHQLLSISLNSVSKYKARILGTVADYMQKTGQVPARLAFALAALFAFYRGDRIDGGALIGQRDGAPYRVQDEAAALEAFRSAWSVASAEPFTTQSCDALVRRVLSQRDLWGQDVTATLPAFTSAVGEHLHAIVTTSIRAALARLD